MDERESVPLLDTLLDAIHGRARLPPGWDVEQPASGYLFVRLPDGRAFILTPKAVA